MQGFTPPPPQFRGVVNWLLVASFMLLNVTAQAGSWSYTTSLPTTRHSHTATLLPNGKVLVTGGYQGHDYGVLNTALLYDPTNDTWSDADWMNTQRTWHTATLLNNGKVLVAGGETSCCSPTRTAELYDPATDTWSNTGLMPSSHTIHTATLLSNGKVLVAGGYYTTNSELYDTATGTWSVTGAMHMVRNWHSATLLQDGKVLVTGGEGTGGTSAELYNPATGQWNVTGSMSVAHTYHSSILLPNGKVLVAGGNNAIAELYNPATGTWTTTGAMHEARSTRASVLLPDGKVLIAGGWGGTNSTTFHTLASLELYNPATGTWTTTGSMNMQRSTFSISLLPNGKVLVAGGEKDNAGCCADTIASAELYTPGPSSPTVFTNAPAIITATSARLSGSVNPNESVTNVTFDFGATTAYGTNIIATPASIAATAGRTAVSANKTGLTCGTTYHYRVKATNSVGTTSGINITFTTSLCPRDLAITSLGITPTYSQVNQAITVRVTVKNQGTMSAAGGTLSLWLDKVAVATCNAASDKTVAIGTLSAGASKAFVISGLTSTTAGNKTLRIFADSTCATVETNESNNQATRSYPVGMPDLTVTSITVIPAAPTHGSTFTVQIVVKNQGSTKLNYTSFLDLWLNQPTNQSCGAAGDVWNEINALAAGASQTITFSGLTAGTAGTKTIRAYADSWCERVDVNRGNNQFIKAYAVQ